ncbi:MAG: peptidoglycan DD-metalloendopeptidase family protein [Clostridia bacterium]|nr:peptidoglycan DD-metalloendopeptidase family protein [Clostridia bacterium]
MNHTLKKQNRILLITLVVILTAAALLIAVTGGANRKNKEENPPLDAKITETPSAQSGKTDTKSPSDSKKTETGDAKDSGKMMTKDGETPAPADPKSAVKDKAESNSSSSSTAEQDKTEQKADAAAEKTVSAMQSELLPVFTLPVDAPVSKGFSGEVPVFSYTMNDYRTHCGIDFACPAGTEIRAAADGTICSLTDHPMMGVTVGISHSGGAVTWYKGLSEESLSLVKTGDSVRRGQVIGTSGSTALIESAEEDHMHFELQVNGAYENPGEFMKVQYLADLPED